VGSSGDPGLFGRVNYQSPRLSLRCYSIISLIRKRLGVLSILLLCFYSLISCKSAIETLTIFSKKTEFRNYDVLKITVIEDNLPYPAWQAIPDRLVKEISDRNLFRTVKRYQKESFGSSYGGSDTLILKLSVVKFDPGNDEMPGKNIFEDGYVKVRYMVIEQIMDSEIYRGEITVNLETYFYEELELHLQIAADLIVKEIADEVESEL